MRLPRSVRPVASAAGMSSRSSNRCARITPHCAVALDRVERSIIQSVARQLEEVRWRVVSEEPT